MSELTMEDKDWIMKEILKAVLDDETCFINDFEPCSAELIKYLEKEGYTVERLPKCDIIHFKQGATNDGSFHSRPVRSSQVQSQEANR